MTKRLFGLKDSAEDPLAIVDGEIFGPDSNTQTDEHIDVDTEIHLNVQTNIKENVCPKEEVKPVKEPASFPVTAVDSVAGIAEGYFVFLSSAGRSKRTVKEYGWELGWWRQHCPDFKDLTLSKIEISIQDLHPSTARRKIAAIRSYAKWLLRNGDDRLFILLSQIEAPRVPVRVPKDKGSKKFAELSLHAVRLTSENDRRGIWLGLMLCCGLRISEIQTAKTSPGGAIKVLGKGNKERLVPCPCWLREAMQSKDINNWRKGRKCIWQKMKNMGIRKPHSLRHTFASELVRQDFELEQVKLLLGHAKLDTTLIYARTRLPENLTQRLGLEV